MGNTSSANTQYSQTYAAKSYEGRVVALEDENGKQTQVLQIIAGNNLQAFIDANTNEPIAILDNLTNRIVSLEGSTATTGQITEINNAIDALDNWKNGIPTDLATQTDLDNLNTNIESIYATQAALSALATSISSTYATQASLNGLESNMLNFHENTLRNSYNFNKFNVGNGWYLQPQSDGVKDLLCVGKGSNPASICINANGDLDYTKEYGAYSEFTPQTPIPPPVAPAGYIRM
jgi:hypothetical protein